MRSRRRITPAIGGYWLRPALMYLVTRSRNALAQSKSGKPCDRLIALCSCASRDITVKIVVAAFGSLEAMERVKLGMAGDATDANGGWRMADGERVACLSLSWCSAVWNTREGRASFGIYFVHETPER